MLRREVCGTISTYKESEASLDQDVPVGMCRPGKYFLGEEEGGWTAGTAYAMAPCVARSQCGWRRDGQGGEADLSTATASCTL